MRYMPKIGPFKALEFNNPTAQTEDLYFKSIIPPSINTVFIFSKFASAHCNSPTVILTRAREPRQPSTL